MKGEQKEEQEQEQEEEEGEEEEEEEEAIQPGSSAASLPRLLRTISAAASKGH